MMWSSLFNSAKPKDNTENDTEANKSSEKSPLTQKVEIKGKRVSKSWFEDGLLTDPTKNNLEGKAGMHNLMDKDKEDVVYNASSSVLSSNRSKRFLTYLETTRISDRPLYVVRQSDSDILKFKEDYFGSTQRDKRGKFITIPILPADEMNTLTSEIKLWHKNRKNFKILFAIAMLCGFALLFSNLAFTLIWYTDLSLLPLQQFPSAKNFAYNMHMNVEAFCLLLTAFGLNIFRLLPETKLTRTILYHALVLLVSFGASITGIGSIVGLDFSQWVRHFYSIHSWLGLAACLLFVFCCLSGFWMLYYPANKVKEYHSRVSYLTFMLGGLTALTGVFERGLIQIGSYYKSASSSPGIVVNVAGVLVVIFCILVRLVASFSYRRRPKPQWDVIVYRNLETIEDVYLEIHDMYDSFELWVKQVNQARMKALQLPRSSIRSSFESGKHETEGKNSLPT